MKYFLFPLLLLLGWNQLASCQNEDSLHVVKRMNGVHACLQRSQVDSAMMLHKDLLRFCEQKSLWIMWLKTHIRIAYYLSDNLNDPRRGVNFLLNGIASFPAKPSPEILDQLSKTYMAAGYIYENDFSDFYSASKQYEKAFEIFVNDLGEHNDQIAGYIYHKLGNAYTRLGDYERAENMLKRGISYASKYQYPDAAKHGDLALALIDQHKNEEALLVILEGNKVKKTGLESQITLKSSESEAYLNLGNVPAARKALGEVLRLINKLSKENSNTDKAYYLAGYYEMLAAIEEADKNIRQANNSLQKALALEIESWQTSFRREIGKKYCIYGEFQMRTNNPRAALKAFQQGLKCVVKSFNPKNDFDNPDAEHFGPENTIFEALDGKARALVALNELDLALSCYELIPIVEAKLRATHFYESSSLLALKESRTRFEEAISIAWQLYERSNGNPQYAERAFRLTELSRGMLLLQSLMQAQQFLPGNIQNRDYEIKIQMAWLEHEIAKEKQNGHKTNQEVIARWEQQLFELKLERQKLLEAFPAYAHPDSMVLQVLAAREVSQWLRKDQAMLSYFLTDSSAYIFSFDPSGHIHWLKTVLPSDFRTLTRNLIQYLWDGKETGKDLFLQNASRLYGWLMEKECTSLGSGITSLVLIPDDVLMMLPFEVLLTQPPSPDRPNWRDQPWLIWQYNVSYAFSATLLKAQMEISNEHLIAPSKPAEVFGGFAPVYAQAGEYPLQNTSGMVKTARKMLGGDAWTKESNQEELFKKTANQYRILLLAMHGISNPEQPELSRLLFGDPGPDSLVNNNILYASELQIMQLQADLVVLSACHSGSGKLEVGEGVYSLARAFAAAKVPSTVMSLWLLQENAAPALVEAFFKYLKEGKSKDEALRLAKREFLWNDERFEMTHPFYWAGLVAAGDMRALELEQPCGYIWWVLTALTLLLVLGWFVYKKAKRRILR